MMGVPPDQARRLTLWEFTAMRANWNKRHKQTNGGDDEPVDLPDVDFVRQRQLELAQLGIATGSVD